MSAPALSRRPRSAAPRPRRAAPPVLVRQVRNGVEESLHRGDVVEVDMTGRVVRLMCKMAGWSPEGYWHEDHPTQVALRDVVARAFRTSPTRLVTGIDQCGIPTFAFPLREIAWAYSLLADPEAIPSDDPRSKLAEHYLTIRSVMLANPELVGGTHDRLDTSVMKAIPGRAVAKGGAEALRAIGILPGPP